MLAGPYPHRDGMMGTYGRILNNMRTSPVLKDGVEFIPHRVTLPADGNLVTRFATDMIRFAKSMRYKPHILHFIMQKYRSVHREGPILSISKARGVKTIVDIRAGSLQSMLERKNYRIQNAVMRRIIRHADAVVLECKKDLLFVKENFGIDGLHIPNAILEEDFLRIKPASLDMEKDQPLKLIYSGRYLRDKGIDVMLKSLDILSSRGIKVELHLTGQGTDGELLEMIKAYAQNPPKGTVVVDHGWDVPDLYGLLSTAHVFVMPTFWYGEGHPNSVIESMVAGHALILSDWPHREDIVPEAGAIIIPPRDHAALADAVQKYVENPSRLIVAGRVNRKFVEDNYLDTICYPRFLKLYRQLCSNVT